MDLEFDAVVLDLELDFDLVGYLQLEVDAAVLELELDFDLVGYLQLDVGAAAVELDGVVAGECVDERVQPVGDLLAARLLSISSSSMTARYRRCGLVARGASAARGGALTPCAPDGGGRLIRLRARR